MNTMSVTGVCYSRLRECLHCHEGGKERQCEFFEKQGMDKKYHSRCASCLVDGKTAVGELSYLIRFNLSWMALNPTGAPVAQIISPASSVRIGTILGSGAMTSITHPFVQINGNPTFSVPQAFDLKTTKSYSVPVRSPTTLLTSSSSVSVVVSEAYGFISWPSNPALAVKGYTIDFASVAGAGLFHSPKIALDHVNKLGLLNKKQGFCCSQFSFASNAKLERNSPGQ